MALRALTNAHLFANELDDALPAARRALDANPNDADSQRDMAAVLLFLGRFDEVFPYLDLALRLNPLETSNRWKSHAIAGGSLLALGRVDAALARLQLSRAADPSIDITRFSLASAEALAGHHEQARAHLAEGLKRRPDWTLAAVKASPQSKHPAFTAGMQRYYEGLKLAGLPEGEPAAAAKPATVARNP